MEKTFSVDFAEGDLSMKERSIGQISCLDDIYGTSPYEKYLANKYRMTQRKKQVRNTFAKVRAIFLKKLEEARKPKENLEKERKKREELPLCVPPVVILLFGRTLRTFRNTDLFSGKNKWLKWENPLECDYPYKENPCGIQEHPPTEEYLLMAEMCTDWSGPRPPNFAGLIICGQFSWKLVDAVCGGRLRKFFEPFCGTESIPDDYSEDEAAQMKEENEDLVNTRLSSLFEPTYFGLIKAVPLDDRYNLDTTGVAIGMFGAVFLTVHDALLGGKKLVIAIAPNREAARCAEDVMDNGFTKFMNTEGTAHWDGTRLKSLARKCFGDLKCEDVYERADSLPWDTTSRAVREWQEQSWRPTTWKDGRDHYPKRSTEKPTPSEDASTAKKARTIKSNNPSL